MGSRSTEATLRQVGVAVDLWVDVATALGGVMREPTEERVRYLLAMLVGFWGRFVNNYVV